MSAPAVSTATKSIAERAKAVLMDTYQRQPIALRSGHGVWVTADDGREYLDLVAGIAVNILGHNHPALQQAIAGQASTLMHTSNLYYTEPQLELAELLIASAFPSRVFFCNSGAEANEGAIKLARKWGKLHRDGAHVIVCAQGAFHGRTMGALAATANPRYRKQFEPLPKGFVHVPYDDLGALQQAIDSATCAVMLEPIEGESGVIPLESGRLAAIRRLCDDRNVLLILDEVQTGMGRTGRWWAHQHEAAAPDVMTVAKALGGGVPIGAILAAPRADVFEAGDHGSTFGGGPLACAAAIAVMRTLESEGLVKHAGEVGDYLAESLSALADRGAPIAGVRGRGLMLGIALQRDVARAVAGAALDQGLIVNAIGDRTLRLVPALIITRDEVDEAVLRLSRAFDSVAGSGIDA
jgi:predicted acetylornithine/succinylornithine family transaminase